jgi:hypothetical protein
MRQGKIIQKLKHIYQGSNMICHNFYCSSSHFRGDKGSVSLNLASATSMVVSTFQMTSDYFKCITITHSVTLLLKLLDCILNFRQDQLNSGICSIFFSTIYGIMHYLPRLALNHDSPTLYLLSS